MSVPGNLYTPTIRKTRGADYLIEQSLLFNDDDSAYLNRTPSTVGNRKTWTFSVWVKGLEIAQNNGIFIATDNTSTSMWGIRYTGSIGGTFEVLNYPGSVDSHLRFAGIIRDPSAWYHLVVAFDTTQGTSSNRIKMYLNGTQLTAFDASTYPALNYEGQINNTVLHTLGTSIWASQYMDGAMALPILVDGAALDATSFGEEDDDGYWNPIEFAGTATVSWTENLSIDDHASKSSTGTASASSEANASSAAEHAFNEVTSGGTNVGWQSSSAGSQWLQFQYDTAQTIKAYYVVGHVAAWSLANRAPNSWTIVGSNTGAFSGEEVTIDTVSGESGWSDQEVRWFDCSDNDTAYTYYRMNISSNNGGTLDSVIEWNMFGQNDTGTGFGTNGFVLDFSDTSNFGDDTSGNGNDYTPNNFTAADQLSDTPTDSADDEIGNFATLNPLTLQANMSASNGNRFLDSSSGDNGCLATLGFSSGKYYWETSIHSGGAGTGVYHVSRGMDFSGKDLKLASNMGNTISTVRRSMCATTSTTNLARYYYNADAATGTISAMDTAADRICCAVDADAQQMWIGHYDATDGVTDWLDVSGGLTGDPATGSNPTFNTGSTGFPSGYHIPLFHTDGTGLTVYFKHSDCLGTIPTGFDNELATQNLPAPTIADGSAHFVTKLWVGNNTFDGTSIDTGMSSIGLGWVKNRTDAADSFLFDTIRGDGVVLSSSSTNAESTYGTSTNYVNEINGADGAGTVRFGASNNSNGSGDNIVGWFWKAGGAGSSDSTGNITVSRSTNTDAGFSIVTGTGNSGSGANFGHGFTSPVHFGIFKNRDSAQTWYVYHKDLVATENVLHLDTDAAASVQSSIFGTSSSSQFYLDGGGVNAGTDDWVGYLWTGVEDFSKFGTYEANGSADGPFVYTGFTPAWIMIKGTTHVSNWNIIDISRATYNPADRVLRANLVDSEFDGTSSSIEIDFLSNGFKIRGGSGANDINQTSQSYIYSAFAAQPFQGDDGYTQARAR
jgi:hypothetical protein